MNTVTNFQQSLKTPILILKGLGAWHNGNSKLWWIYTLVILLIFLIPMISLHMTKLVLDEEVTIVKVANCIFLNAETGIVPFIFLLLIYSHKNVKIALEILESKVFNSYTLIHLNILQQGANAIRKNEHYITLCVLTVFLMLLSPIAHWKEKWLLVDIWIPFDPKNYPFYYVLVHIYTCIGLMICSLGNSSVVILTCGLLIHGTTQIKILKSNLKRISREKEENKLYEKISHCVAHYVAIIKYIRFVESSLSLPLSIHLLSCIVVVCLSAFLLTVTPIYDIFFATIVLYLCCVVLETFLVCHFGEYLVAESLTICEAAYFSQWQNFDGKSKKALLIFMERAKVPLRVQPGGVFMLSNQTFARIIRSAYSLFTVLQNFDVAAN